MSDSHPLPPDEMRKRITGFGSTSPEDEDKVPCPNSATSPGDSEENVTYQEATNSLWTNAMESMSMERTKEAVKEAADSTTEAVKEATEGMVSGVSTAAISMGDAMKEAGGAIKEGVGGFFGRISERFSRKVPEEEKDKTNMKREDSSSSCGTLGKSSSNSDGEVEKISLAELVLRELVIVKGTQVAPTVSELRHFCQRAAGVTPREQMVRRVLAYLSFNNGDTSWQEKVRVLHGVKAFHEQGMSALFKSVVVNGSENLKVLCDVPETSEIAKEVLALREERVKTRAEVLEREHKMRQDRVQIEEDKTHDGNGVESHVDAELDANVVSYTVVKKSTNVIIDPDHIRAENSQESFPHRKEAERILKGDDAKVTPNDELIKSINPDSLSPSSAGPKTENLLDLLDEGEVIGDRLVRESNTSETGGPGTRKPEVNRIVLRTNRENESRAVPPISSASSSSSGQTSKKKCESDNKMDAEERSRILDLVKANDEGIALKVSFDGGPDGRSPVSNNGHSCSVDLLDIDITPSPTDGNKQNRYDELNPVSNDADKKQRKSAAKKTIAVKLKETQPMIGEEVVATTPALEAPPMAADSRVSPKTLGDVFDERRKEVEQAAMGQVVPLHVAYQSSNNTFNNGMVAITDPSYVQASCESKYNALNPAYVHTLGVATVDEGDVFSELMKEGGIPAMVANAAETSPASSPFQDFASGAGHEVKKILKKPASKTSATTFNISDPASKSTASKTSDEPDGKQKRGAVAESYGVLNLTAAGLDAMDQVDKADPFGKIVADVVK